MNRIEHIVEPRRLFLSWQRPMAGAERRTRRIVGEIERDGDRVVFRYLADRDDFRRARDEGFEGFPTFKLTPQAHQFTDGVLDAFMRRLPPRKRDDFSQYLAQYRLPENFAASDMTLLAYTGAKLPSDGFELVPDLTGIAPPFEILMEVAGFRHNDVSTESISIGDPVELVREPENPVDPEAIAVTHARGKIGYIARPFCGAVANWLSNFSYQGHVERINGKPDRPLVYLFIRIFNNRRAEPLSHCRS